MAGLAARRCDVTMGDRPQVFPRIALNRVAAVCFSLWVCLPQLNYSLPTWVGVSIALVWLLTSGRFLSLAGWTADMWSAGIFMFVLSPYALVWTFNYGSQSALPVLGTFFLFLVGIPMSTYYLGNRGDAEFGRNLFWIATAAYSVGALQTLAGLNVHPDASRLLAAARDVTDQFKAEGIGGFGFIYGASLMCLPLAGIALNRRCGRMPRLFCSTTLILIFIALARASYTISVLGTIAGVALIVIGRRPRVVVGSLTVMTVFLLFLHEQIGNTILDIVHSFTMTPVLTEKLSDLSYTLQSGVLSGQTGFRIDLYGASLNAFLSNPLFGIIGSPWQGGGEQLGGHSGWLDLLGGYGLLAGVPLFLSVLLFFRKIAAWNIDAHSRSLLLVSAVLFMCFGLINPILNIYQVGYTLFLIVPLGMSIAKVGRILPLDYDGTAGD